MNYDNYDKKTNCHENKNPMQNLILLNINIQFKSFNNFQTGKQARKQRENLKSSTI